MPARLWCGIVRVCYLLEVKVSGRGGEPIEVYSAINIDYIAMSGTVEMNVL